METLFNFIRNHWETIVSVLIFIISVVFSLVTRRRISFNQIDSIKKDVLEMLPTIINSVEEDGNGQRKKLAALELVTSYCKKKYGLDLSLDLLSFFSLAIENILSTPKKKEVAKNGKD